MNLDEKSLDIKRLKEDLVDYFSTAINPFDVDLFGVEEIEYASSDKLINIARNNGFNINHYKIKDDNN